MSSRRILLMVLLLAGCAQTAPKTAVDPLPAPPFHLHLPGIGGKLRMDRYMIEGLRSAGMDAEIEVYDWTANDPGLDALFAQTRNRDEAEHVAKIILDKYRQDPRMRITITAHSGGAGLAVWALEKLPPDVQVDSVVFLAAALSPDYDLSAALRHVRGKAYAFNSYLDVAVLGIGTRVFGTIDGVKTEAAGKVGFIRPPGGDETQYAKLVQFSYDRTWMQYGNIGDHIGPMNSRFARDVLEPLLEHDRLPPHELTTMPAEATP